MCTILYEIEELNYANDRRVVAVCSTKAKAQAKLKELVDDPPCSQPVREACEFDDDFAHVENKHGWWANYYIREIWLDEWID